MAHNHSKVLLHNFRKSTKTHIMRSLVRNLILCESINTTVNRAKALRMIIEPLITKAKHNKTTYLYKKLNDALLVKKLKETLAPRYENRPGGYTRIVRTHLRSDGATMAQIVLL